jgi:hypothetical protein
MLTRVSSSMRRGGYQDAVRVAERTLVAYFGANIGEYLDVAMHAMNACQKYVAKGQLRLQHLPNGQAVIVIVTKHGDPVVSPSIQALMNWAEPEQVLEFLALTSGIGVLTNVWREDNPF